MCWKERPPRAQVFTHPERSEVDLTAQILVVMGPLTQLKVWLRLKMGLLASQSTAAAWVPSGQPCWLKVA